jgi:hypothetical protein
MQYNISRVSTLRSTIDVTYGTPFGSRLMTLLDPTPSAPPAAHAVVNMPCLRTLVEVGVEGLNHQQGDTMTAGVYELTALRRAKPDISLELHSTAVRGSVPSGLLQTELRVASVWSILARL